MELSLFLAQVIGVVLFIVGFGFICNAKHYQKAFVAILKNEGIILFSSMFALILGTIIVLTHNIWETSWVVIITIFGWVGLLKGFSLAVFPKSAIKMSSAMLKTTGMFRLAGVFLMLFGGAMLYFGFFA